MSTLKINEDKFLVNLRLGNSRAYNYIINLYFPILKNFVLKITKSNDQVSEDIVVEIFIKLWKAREAFTSLLHIKKFLYVSSRNSAFNFLKMMERERKRNEIFTYINNINEDILYRETNHAELIAQIRSAINNLPTRLREIFILSFIYNNSNKEIAGKLNITNQNVRNQKNKALNIIKQSIYQIKSI